MAAERAGLSTSAGIRHLDLRAGIPAFELRALDGPAEGLLGVYVDPKGGGQRRLALAFARGAGEAPRRALFHNEALTGLNGRFAILPSSRVARKDRLGPPGRRHAAQAGVEVVRVKKSLVVILACTLSAALAACGGKPKERPGSTEAGRRATPAAPAVDMSVVPGAPFVLTQTLKTPLNNQELYLGFSFDTGLNTPVVTHLGRWKISGNSQTHNLHLYKYVNGSSDVQIGTASVDLSTGSAGTYIWAALGSPVTLLANTRYYVTCQEMNGGDTWFNHVGTTLDSFTAGVGIVYGSVISGSPGRSAVGEKGSTTFGPVNIWVRPNKG